MRAQCRLVSPYDVRKRLDRDLVVVVLGDLILDVDVLPPLRDGDHRHLSMALGGVGRSAEAAAMLGARVVLISALGTGRAASSLRTICVSTPYETILGRGTGPQAYYLRDGGVATGRGRADSQLGRVEFAPVDTGILAAADAVVVSDYGRGTVAGLFAQYPDALDGFTGPIVVDSKYGHYEHVPRIGWITPSIGDLCALNGGEVRSSESNLVMARAAGARWASNVAVTEGALGATVVAGGTVAAFRAPSCDVYAEHGAGDCFAATFATGLAAGWPVLDVARLAVGVASWYVTKERYLQHVPPDQPMAS